MKSLKNIAGVAFLPLFLVLSWALAKILTSLVPPIGISSRLMLVVSMFGLMLTFSWNYLRVWKGFLLSWCSSRPNLSITKDVSGLKPVKDHPSLVWTDNGYRLIVEIRLPEAEYGSSERRTLRALRVLFRYPIVSALYFQEKRPGLQHTVDTGCEPGLAAILRIDNSRLKQVPARGRIRMLCCISVPDLETGQQIVAESDLIQMVPWETFGSELGLWGSGAVSTSTRAFSVPAVVEHEGGRSLPILITEYGDEYVHQPNHQRIMVLSEYLDRPVAWHCLTVAVSTTEIRRIARLRALESAYPSAGLDSETRRELDETTDRLETLERSLSSGQPPRLLKSFAWIQLEPDDDPRVILSRAREWLFERHLTAQGLTPARALAAHASLHPGLERHCVDTKQGLGIIGSEDEVACEMEASSQWTGAQDASLILQTSSGHAINFSLFEGNNYNLVIVGEPGSGKSVLINGLTAGHLGRSRYNRVILVDYGGSFSGLVETAGGLQIGHNQPFTINPFPELGEILSADDFTSAYPGGSYGQYLSDQNELLKQTLEFLRGLCGPKFADSAVFREAFCDLARQHHRGSLLERLESMSKHAACEAAKAQTDLRRTAWEDLHAMCEEVGSVCKTTPFIGDGDLDIRKPRLVSFNLDGFSREDKQMLVGLISLLVNQVFSASAAGKTLIVFDEVHKFIRELGTLLDGTSRVTRKYGASLVLASQSPSDYAACPSLVENANHHIIMRLKTAALSPEWKITDPAILEHARTGTPPADLVGYSTIHLGTTNATGDLQSILLFKFSPLSLYAFTSKIRDKNIMAMACKLIGLQDPLALAEAVHGTENHPKLVPIGSPVFWEEVGARLLPRFSNLRGHLPQLCSDLEVCPLLDLFLKSPRRFDLVTTDRNELTAWMNEHYGVQA